MNPAANINGIAHQVSNAPPVSNQSVMFIALSIPIIDIKLIPAAVFNESRKDIPARNKIKVSSKILVINPLIIANIIMASVGQGI